MDGLTYMDELTKMVVLHEVNKLHSELASLYGTKSRDTKRIDLLWRAIEARENTLKAEGVPGPWA